MTRAGVAYYEREQRDLVRINYVELTRSPLSAASGDALGHVGYFAELIDEWAPEAHADERLYRLGSSVTDAIADRSAGRPAGAGTSSTGSCACRASTRARSVSGLRRTSRRWRGHAAAGRAVRVPVVCAERGRAGWCRSTALPESGQCHSAGRAGLVAARGKAARELEAVHRRLLTVHLDKDLKSARVLREMRGSTR